MHIAHHLNIYGLSSKIDYVKFLLHQIKIDVFSICETKINDTITDLGLKIDGYVLYRHDRDRNGGSVLFYINENLDSHPLKHLQCENIESLWVKLCLKKSKPLYLCGVYKPPGGSDFQSTENVCTHLVRCIQKLPRKKKFLLCGILSVTCFQSMLCLPKLKTYAQVFL